MFIFNELPTAFPWYDKKEKQQRYRENARNNCDYRLISPRNAMLPFQFIIPYNEKNMVPGIEFIDNSFVNYSNGVFDVRPPNVPSDFARTDFVNVSSYDELYYRIGYSGAGYALYDSSYTYISGAPLATTGTIDVSGASYVVINVSNNPANRGYQKFVFNLSESPIQPIVSTTVEKWEIHSCCGIVIDITDNASLLKSRMYEDGARVYYKGDELKFRNHLNALVNLKLTANSYYSVITFDDGSKHYSEVFTVPDNYFEKGDKSPYMMLEFWNDCDIEPIMYNDGEGGWKQVLYVDSFIHASEPEVEEDGERDGNDMLIPTFQRMVVRYRFSAAVPDFIKIALVSMQIHDNVFVTTEHDIRRGKIERMSSSATLSDDGAYSILDVVLEQYVLVKNSCCANMALVNP